MNDTTIMPDDGTAMAVIPASSLPRLIAADKENLLGDLAAKVKAFKPDVSTKKGRDEMRRLATEIRSTKAEMDRLGKALGEDAKATVDAINAERRVLREKMEELEAHVRGPLTAYEDAEKERVAGHEQALADMVEAPHYGQTETAAEIAQRLEYLRTYPARDWREFADRAAATLAGEIDRMERLHAAAAQREADAAELARLRQEAAQREREQAEQERQAHEAAIAAAAAERARQEEREAAARREQDARDAAARAEREKAEAIEHAKQIEEQAKRDRAAAAEREAEAARQREADQLEAKRREEAAAEDARKQEEARQERIRADKEALAERAAEEQRKEDEARQRNVAHRRSINRAALAAMIAVADGLTEDAAKALISAIAEGRIPHITIEY